MLDVQVEINSKLYIGNTKNSNNNNSKNQHVRRLCDLDPC